MPLIEIFRSPHARDCEHRAFVLRAVGIGSDIVRAEDAFLLRVEFGAADIARDQLERYAQENAQPIESIPEPTIYPLAWAAPFVYTTTMLVCAFLAGRDSFGFDWYESGALTHAIQSHNQWWRAVTALTLHVDHQHLLSNLGFGALFLFAAARLIGFGATLAATMLAAIFGNVLDSALMPASHISVGASTWVFATLGLVSAYSWRIRYSGRLRWAHRWAPLIAGVMLLGFLGTSGENTDVLAHLSGFAFGAAFGALLAYTPKRVFDNALTQVLGATIPIVSIALAWLISI